eukprot:scaffold11192_cov77-Phaeocystis_antarctica.AAC.6
MPNAPATCSRMPHAPRMRESHGEESTTCLAARRQKVHTALAWPSSAGSRCDSRWIRMSSSAIGPQGMATFVPAGHRNEAHCACDALLLRLGGYDNRVADVDESGGSDKARALVAAAGRLVRSSRKLATAAHLPPARAFPRCLSNAGHRRSLRAARTRNAGFRGEKDTQGAARQPTASQTPGRNPNAAIRARAGKQQPQADRHEEDGSGSSADTRVKPNSHASLTLLLASASHYCGEDAEKKKERDTHREKAREAQKVVSHTEKTQKEKRETRTGSGRQDTLKGGVPYGEDAERKEGDEATAIRQERLKR